MNRFSKKYPDKTPIKDPEDPLNQLLAQRGALHEEKQINAFKSLGLQVSRAEGKTHEEQYLSTLRLMKTGIDVIVQARL